MSMVQRLLSIFYNATNSIHSQVKLTENAHTIVKCGKIKLMCSFTSFFKYCAADFSLLNLPKGKSLGRSKPATNS
jgi:hypothetical protein